MRLVNLYPPPQSKLLGVQCIDQYFPFNFVIRDSLKALTRRDADE